MTWGDEPNPEAIVLLIVLSFLVMLWYAMGCHRI